MHANLSWIEQTIDFKIEFPALSFCGSGKWSKTSTFNVMKPTPCGSVPSVAEVFQYRSILHLPSSPSTCKSIWSEWCRVDSSRSTTTLPIHQVVTYALLRNVVTVYFEQLITISGVNSKIWNKNFIEKVVSNILMTLSVLLRRPPWRFHRFKSQTFELADSLRQFYGSALFLLNKQERSWTLKYFPIIQCSLI